MKKGLKRLITIIFIPHSQRSSYNVRIPLAIFYFLLVFITGTVILSGLFFFKYGEFTKTKRTNLELLSEVAKIRETMVSVTGLSAKLRSLTGSSRESEVATGGPVQENLTSIMEEEFLEKKGISLSELEKELEGEAVREAFLPSINPVEKGWIISKSSKGLEFASLPGSAVRATAEGKILYGSQGKIIIDHGNNLETEYTNLERIRVKVGEEVKKAQEIGYVKEKKIFYQVKKFNKEIDLLGYMSEYAAFSGAGR